VLGIALQAVGVELFRFLTSPSRSWHWAAL
jgi:hypothetical protein